MSRVQTMFLTWTKTHNPNWWHCSQHSPQDWCSAASANRNSTSALCCVPKSQFLRATNRKILLSFERQNYNDACKHTAITFENLVLYCILKNALIVMPKNENCLLCDQNHLCHPCIWSFCPASCLFWRAH